MLLTRDCFSRKLFLERDAEIASDNSGLIVKLSVFSVMRSPRYLRQDSNFLENDVVDLACLIDGSRTLAHIKVPIPIWLCAIRGDTKGC